MKIENPGDSRIMTLGTADGLSTRERRQMIAVAAYYLAEQRGFAPGGEEADWLHAERLIDAMIAAGRLEGLTGPDAGRAAIRNALRLQSHPRPATRSSPDQPQVRRGRL